MSIVNYTSSSPYYDTLQTSWYLLPWSPREIPADSTDVKYEITPKYQYRPDLLSYEFYSSPSYWWVFMIRNIDLIRDPIWDFVPGKIIYVPTQDRIKNLLG